MIYLIINATAPIQFCKLEFTLINIFQTLYDYQSGLP